MSDDPIFNVLKSHISHIQGIGENRVLRVETRNGSNSHLQREEPPPGVTDTSKLRISCFALSKVPIEKFLKEALEKERQKRQGHVRIYNPHPNFQTRYQHPWEEAQPRMNRPLETVVLDPKMKKMVLDDMMAYISPQSKDWYASRGVPYRRGYLFYGPPGTGKSSFCLALAGKLGLLIHTLSLQSSNMTDEGLSFLLSQPKGPCIVLLEDIDAIDFNRDSNESPKDSTQGNSKKPRGFPSLVSSTPSTEWLRTKEVRPVNPGWNVLACGAARVLSDLENGPIGSNATCTQLDTIEEQIQLGIE
ncbi:mitochondrial chaperone bcs1 [Ilyonectria robusta]